MISAVLAALTRYRRRSQDRPRHLGRPVISIGNIAAGGRAKTPMAALVARVLLAAGERPAILSRGYARARAVEEPVIVRDAGALHGSLAESGDEPLMLANQLDGAIVVVSADRARAGVVAERLGATVHILDDGFQHLRVARDVDIVMIVPDDVHGSVMPMGRLREPADALKHADAVVVLGGEEDANRVYSTGKNFRAARRVAPPSSGLAAQRAFLVSGIADNAQFAAAVRDAGWQVAGEAGFRDHHRYSIPDAERIAQGARAAGASFVLTTAKDVARLREVWRDGLPLQVAEMDIVLDQPDDFAQWLIGRVHGARASRDAGARRRLEDGARRAS